MKFPFEDGQEVIVNEDGKKATGVVDAFQVVGDKVTKVVVKIDDKRHPKHCLKVAFNPDQVSAAASAPAPKTEGAKTDK